MMRIFKYYILSILLLVLAFAKAQDVHFSQYYLAPNILNPASIGTFNGDFRAMLNFKDQWSQIRNAYRTFNATFDAPLFKNRLDEKVVGVGGSVYRDVAGDSKLTTLYASLGASYTFNLSRSVDLTFGVTGSYMSLTANYQGLSWGSQYNGIEYVPILPSGEVFAGFSERTFDANFGTLLRIYDYNGYPWEIGVSATHLTTPNIGLGDINDDIPMKFILHSSKIFELPNEDWAFIYHAMIAKQRAANEINIGGMLSRKLGMRSIYTGYNKGNQMYGGLFARISGSYDHPTIDALVLHAVFNYEEKYTIGVSYDFNVSSLTSASLYRGGFEVSLGYSGFFDTRYQVVSPRAF